MVAPEQLESIAPTLLSWGNKDADLKAVLGGNLVRLVRSVRRPGQAPAGF